MLVIAPIEKLTDFADECSKIENHFKSAESISVDVFLSTFPNIKDYLIIPHYDKSPVIPDSVIKRLQDHIFCGEVQSPKKFEYCIKDSTRLTPVLFSDFRQYDFESEPSKHKTFPIRQTFIDCSDLTLTNIKLALKDKGKVSLTPAKFDQDFQLLSDGTIASTGINVILGQRSSGKTYTLDTIQNTYDPETINYIKQFSLVEGNDQKRFQETTEREKSDVSSSYLSELKLIVNRVAAVDLCADKAGISEYITSLIAYAKSQDKNDAYSKTKLFSETLHAKEEIGDLKKVIQATTTLLDNIDYKAIIEKNVSVEGLKNLFIELNTLYEKKRLINKIADETNSIVKTIKDLLGKKSAITQPTDWDFISYAKNDRLVTNFNSLINSLTTEKVILEDNVFGSFKIIGKCIKIKNVTELKSQFSDKEKPSIDRTDYERYPEPYDLLRFLLKDNLLKTKDDAYKIYWRIEYEIQNSFGKPLSGGEKAEYNLLAKLKDSQKYDLILIDEPESSFDNPFLKSNVIQIIRDLAIKSTVFIVTHNNNLGVLIRPNRLLYTEKQITVDGVDYKIFSGNYDAKELVTASGEKKLNFTALIDAMEAGEVAYKERKEVYDLIKNS